MHAYIHTYIHTQGSVPPARYPSSPGRNGGYSLNQSNTSHMLDRDGSPVARVRVAPVVGAYSFVSFLWACISDIIISHRLCMSTCIQIHLRMQTFVGMSQSHIRMMYVCPYIQTYTCGVGMTHMHASESNHVQDATLNHRNIHMHISTYIPHLFVRRYIHANMTRAPPGSPITGFGPMPTIVDPVYVARQEPVHSTSKLSSCTIYIYIYIYIIMNVDICIFIMYTYI